MSQPLPTFDIATTPIPDAVICIWSMTNFQGVALESTTR